MIRRACLPFLLFLFAMVPSARATNRFIVRSSIGPTVLSELCLLQGCTVVRALDGVVNQLFLLTAPNLVDPNLLLTLLRATPGIVDAELDQVVSLVGDLNRVTSVPSGLSDKTPVNFFGSIVWNGYAAQPAGLIVRSAEARNTFQVNGAGIVADIDTGVDPNHPALQGVLLPGYDFTRNQPGGSELNDFTQPPPSGNAPQVGQVNQYTAAILDSNSILALDGQSQYAAFGHGTMVMGIIHLVAPTAKLLPLKAFTSAGTANLADILNAVYYAAQNNANVINMSFDLTSNSPELVTALTYANQLNVICASSAGNDGAEELVYPAALNSLVMGVASTSDLDTRSSFSNFGDSIVWTAAPGEAIVTTYPFATYSVGWGTSFSAPFVSGTASLIVNSVAGISQLGASAALTHGVPVGPDLGNGRLDIVMTLQSLAAVARSPKIGLGETQLGFGGIRVGASSGTQQITVSNTGTAALTISSILISALNSADFSQSNTCGTSLAIGSQCAITLTFSPTASGVLNSSISISDNAPGSPHAVTLSGTGLAPSLSPSALGLSYPSEIITSKAAPQSLTLTNTGNETLNISSIALSGANSGDFSTSNSCGTTVLTGASCSVTTTFTPTASGLRSATLTIVDDAPGSPHTFAITGTGSDFAVGLKTGAPSSATVNSGQTAVYNLQVNSISGLTGTVTFTCSGAPTASTCTLAPPAVTFGGASSAPLTVSIQTTARSVSGQVVHRYQPLSGPMLSFVECAFVLLLMLFAADYAMPFRRSRPALLWALVVVALLCSSCGGGNSVVKPPPAQGTPAGTYNVTVLGTSQGVSHSETVTITVN
jgi:hypothetical protein